MKKAILIQARLSSERFPEKVLASFVGRVPLIEYVYRRSRTSKLADVVSVITSTDKTDDALFAYCQNHGIKVFRGALDNVLYRYIKAAEFFKADVVCRVCGDSPFVDTELIDRMFEMQSRERIDYIAPDRKTCASGFYSETMTLDALKKVASTTSKSEDLEHVTKHILDNGDQFSIKLIDAGLNPPFARGVRFTMDYPTDAELVDRIASGLADDYSFSSQDVLGMIEMIKGV